MLAEFAAAAYFQERELALPKKAKRPKLGRQKS